MGKIECFEMFDVALRVPRKINDDETDRTKTASAKIEFVSSRHSGLFPVFLTLFPFRL